MVVCTYRHLCAHVDPRCIPSPCHSACLNVDLARRSVPGVLRRDKAPCVFCLQRRYRVSIRVTQGFEYQLGCSATAPAQERCAPLT